MASFFSIHMVHRYQDCSLPIVLYHIDFVGSSRWIVAWITFVYNYSGISNLHCKVVRSPNFSYPECTDFSFGSHGPVWNISSYFWCCSANHHLWSPSPSLNHDLYFRISSLYQSWPLHSHFSLSSLFSLKDSDCGVPFFSPSSSFNAFPPPTPYPKFVFCHDHVRLCWQLLWLCF